jgi:hypothetical protein
MNKWTIRACLRCGVKALLYNGVCSACESIQERRPDA